MCFEAKELTAKVDELQQHNAMLIDAAIITINDFGLLYPQELCKVLTITHKQYSDWQNEQHIQWMLRLPRAGYVRKELDICGGAVIGFAVDVNDLPDEIIAGTTEDTILYAIPTERM